MESGLYFVGEFMGYDQTKNPDFVVLKVYDGEKVNKLISPVEKLNGWQKGDNLFVRVKQSIKRKVDESTGRERVDVSFFCQDISGEFE